MSMTAQLANYPNIGQLVHLFAAVKEYHDMVEIAAGADSVSMSVSLLAFYDENLFLAELSDAFYRELHYIKPGKRAARLELLQLMFKACLEGCSYKRGNFVQSSMYSAAKCISEAEVKDFCEQLRYLTLGRELSLIKQLRAFDYYSLSMACQAFEEQFTVASVEEMKERLKNKYAREMRQFLNMNEINLTLLYDRVFKSYELWKRGYKFQEGEGYCVTVSKNGRIAFQLQDE